MTPPPSARLADADARELFIHETGENFCVSAGAGVGKTRAITERIASLAARRVAQPDILTRLVVVTYGRLAAEELRVRARDRLMAQLSHRSSFEREQLLAELRRAFFGTIHAFCLKLLHDHGRYIGVPAGCELLEEGRAEDALWARFCDSEALAALAFPPRLLARVERHLTFEQLLALARELDPAEIEELLADDDPTLGDKDFQPNFEAALADKGGANPKGKAATLAHQERLRRWLRDLADETGRSFLKLPEFKTGSGTFKAAAADALRPYARWLNAAAGHLAALIAQAWRAYRLERGLMTYRDQIFWARRLLDRPATLRALRERGYVVILDEAQDTDAEMFAVLSELTRPVEAPRGDWPWQADAAGPEPGRFSFVGDEQQAIYRERADPAVYEAYVRAFREGRGGRHLEFSVTMRCPAAVVNVVNGIFAHGRLDQSHLAFRALDTRPDCANGAAWRLDLSALDVDAESGVGDRLQHECESLAQLLAERGKTGLAIQRWDEVAVISPRIAWLETAAPIFAARDLPVSLLSQKRTARELPAFAWPAALLHILVHPWDRFELLGVLRELFAISDVELLRWHRRPDGGLVFWPTLPPALSSAPAGLRAALETLHALRAAMPGEDPGGPNDCPTLGRFLDRVLEKTALAARLHAIGDDEAAVAGALDRLRIAALDAENAGVPLRTWARTLVGALEAPPPALPGAPDSIQFLTCQKAKGLEWPVVIPLGLGRVIKDRTPEYPRLEREGVTQVWVHFSAMTIDSDAAAAREKARREELQRFLYVTLTRTQRLLILPDGAELYAGGSGANFLDLARWSELKASDDWKTWFSDSPMTEEDDAGSLRGRPSPVLPETTEQNRALLRRAAAISQRIPTRILPSSLAHDLPQPSAEKSGVPIVGADEDLRRILAEDAASLEGSGATAAEEAITPVALLGGGGGKDYGNWWHETLEAYPWQDSDVAGRLAHLQARLAVVPTGASDLAERAGFELARFSGSRAHAELLAGGRVFLAEAPFSFARSADEWLEGIIDLVVITETGDVWVVDWKTDRRKAAETDDALLARLAEKYGPQLAAYAELFERGLRRKVTRRLLYSTPLGRAIEVSP